MSPYDQNARPKNCTHCGVAFVGSNNRSFCTDTCRQRYAATRKREAAPMRAAQADAFLTREVQLEVAPPWVRHPEPWTDVAGGLRG